MNILYPLYLNLAAAVIFFITGGNSKVIRKTAVAVGTVSLVLSAIAAFNPLIPAVGFIRMDTIARMVYLAVAFFGALLALYSYGDIENKSGKYFSYFFLTLFASQLAVVSSNWIIFTVGWGISGVCLYLLMQFRDGAAAAAKKTIIIIGGSDSLLILGIAVVYKITGTLSMTASGWSLLAASALLAAAFAKAGSFPLHTWLPEAADKSPVAVTAFLPASLDKLLGIYLTARIFSIFSFPQEVRIAVMLIGALTITGAVFMALSQHTAKKLLAYHAISQVGYMVLGLGTGTPIGIAGGLFHMLNHAMYKCALFMGIGQVEKIKGTDRLEKLGGLAGAMPVTFTSMLVASFAISGIPPLNGFFSKWMIYHGMLTSMTTDFGFLNILCLIAALFGSALTLASFMKLIHAVFLGPRHTEEAPATLEKEKISLVLPQAVLAAMCVIFGVFAVKLFIVPVFGTTAVAGWQPGAALVLMLAGIILGGIIYLLSGAKVRRGDNFLGGYDVTEQMRVSGVEFYASIENIFPFRGLYSLAGKKVFDLYEILMALVAYLAKPLREFHNGSLPNYLGWIFLGGIIILLIL